MNSIIEAQEEYFDYQFIPLAPGLPVVLRYFTFWDGTNLHIGRNQDYEKKEMIDYQKRNNIYKYRRKQELWDQKISN
jgi:hypothetical protein